MNKLRRKTLSEILDRIEGLQLEIQEVLDEEQESLDNLPESFQNGEKGEKMQEFIDYLEYAVSSLDECKDNINAVIE